MDPRSQDPASRVRSLADTASTFKFDNNIPIKRYLRSGNEIIRMADVYSREGNLENAYILYMKFLIIYVEKFLEHPEYSTLDSKDKQLIAAKPKQVLPIAENIKQQLLKKYKQEHNEYEDELREQQEFDRVRKEKELAEEKKRMEDEIHEKQLLEQKAKLLEEARQQLAHLSCQQEGTVGKSLYPVNNIQAKEDESKSRIPEVKRNLKPNSMLSSSHLRTVILPASLISEFVVIAHPNTERNVETCGILAGILAKNQFWITHLLIPKQHGTSDSCTTHNEEELFAVQDKHNLITLGWIHTHPTQTAFLSSVDLHTHCSYQLMMPEAVAVVCAPKYNETGYFVLTPSHGLETIANCKEQGFHPHQSNPPLFQVANHVEVHPCASATVLDLRKNAL